MEGKRQGALEAAPSNLKPYSSYQKSGKGESIGLNTVVVVLFLTKHNNCVASCMAGNDC